jgi:hypothetical protein
MLKAACGTAQSRMVSNSSWAVMVSGSFRRHGMSDRPCAFGADLLNDSVGREIGQEQRGDEHGAEDGFNAV